MIGMTWPLTWRNVSAAILNATLQLLVIYRYRCELIATEYLIITQIIDDLNLSLNQTILNLLIESHNSFIRYSLWYCMFTQIKPSLASTQNDE